MNKYKPQEKTNNLQKQVTYSLVDHDKLSSMNKNHNKSLKVNATNQYCVTHWYYDLLECSVVFFLSYLLLSSILEHLMSL